MANMKRGGEFESGMEGPKRSRAQTDRFEMRVLVPSKVGQPQQSSVLTLSLVRWRAP